MSLQIEKTHEVSGDQRRTKAGDNIAVHYTGSLTNGTVFDSSHNRGKPIEFQLGAGRVIKGWDQGLLDMAVGEKRTLTIPPDMAYGARGVPGAIPPNATLIFQTEMMKIN
eukprot:Rmarinus@m.21209